jgi:hypothetical protein
MKRTVIACAILAVASTAHAESFFQVEAGLGAARVTDIGDGNWTQYGAPNNHERLKVPVANVGITGELFARNNWSVRYHADYVYVGEYASTCDCAQHDEDYDPVHHVMRNPDAQLGYYNGHGHLNGVALTLDAGYTYRGYRFAIEGGIWAYRQSWNQYAKTSWGEWNLQTSNAIRMSYVVGARVEHGPFSVSYRYYNVKQDWSNTVPGLAGGVHAVTVNYRF